MARKLSPQMKATLESLTGWEGMLFAGTTTGEVEASGGSRSSLYLAVKKGWVNPYAHDYEYAAESEDKTPKYYLTKEGATALEEDGWLTT